MKGRESGNGTGHSQDGENGFVGPLPLLSSSAPANDTNAGHDQDEEICKYASSRCNDVYLLFIYFLQSAFSCTCIIHAQHVASMFPVSSWSHSHKISAEYAPPFLYVSHTSRRWSTLP